MPSTAPTCAVLRRQLNRAVRRNDVVTVARALRQVGLRPSDLDAQDDPAEDASSDGLRGSPANYSPMRCTPTFERGSGPRVPPVLRRRPLSWQLHDSHPTPLMVASAKGYLDIVQVRPQAYPAAL